VIRRNVDVVAIAALLVGLAFAGSIRDSRIVQVVSAGTFILPEQICRAVVNVVNAPSIQWRSY
jgi:hypothetical protein